MASSKKSCVICSTEVVRLKRHLDDEHKWLEEGEKNRILFESRVSKEEISKKDYISCPFVGNGKACEKYILRTG